MQTSDTTTKIESSATLLTELSASDSIISWEPIPVRPLMRYRRENREDASEDHSWDEKFLLLLPGDKWLFRGRFDARRAEVKTWNRLNYESLISEAYKIRTASPTPFNWIARETESHPKRNVEWLVPCLNRIWQFSQMRGNWDGYGALVPSRRICFRALDVAIEIARITSSASFPLEKEPLIGPLASGGIAFEIYNRNRELHIDLEPGRIEMADILKVTVLPSGQEIEEELEIPDSELSEVLLWISSLG